MEAGVFAPPALPPVTDAVAPETIDRSPPTVPPDRLIALAAGAADMMAAIFGSRPAIDVRSPLATTIWPLDAMAKSNTVLLCCERVKSMVIARATGVELP